jgi:hypothetical protein
MKIILQELDKPNKNNRSYTKAAMEKAIEEANKRPLLGTLGVLDGPTVPMTEVAFSVSNLHIEGDFLVGEAKILKTPKGMELEGMLTNPSSIAFRTAGVGTVGADGVVSDFVITYISAIPADTAA